MPELSGILQPEGALVAVEIGLSRSEVQRLRNAARPVPAAVPLRALLDTGAECSCVDPQALTTLALPLKNIGMANIPAIGGLAPTFECVASLTVVHPSGDSRLNLVIHTLLLAEVSLAALGYEVLIGRDVLKRCRFLYDGPGDRFKLAY
jgi:hypothetical protein